VIVDVVNQSQALIDGPQFGVGRQAINFNRLSLTDFKVKIAHTARTGAVRKAIEKDDLVAKWDKSSWARKLASRKRRAELSDFERFQAKVAKQQRNKLASA